MQFSCLPLQPYQKDISSKENKNYLVGNKNFLPLQSFRRKAGSEMEIEEGKNTTIARHTSGFESGTIVKKDFQA